MELIGSRFGRRNDVVIMALINLSGLLLCLLTATFPAHPDTRVELAWACAGFAAFVTAVVWFAGARWPDITVRSAIVIHIVAATAMITTTASAQGAMNATFANLWVAVYAAAFFPLAHARLVAVSIAVLYGVAFSVHPQMEGIINAHSWMAAGGTTLIGTEVLGRLIRRLTSLTTVDPLTGASNRLGFELQLRQARAAAVRRNEPLSLAMLDLDNFKQFNDRQGHAAGDEMLRAVVAAWNDNARPEDVIGRYGGDEFLCLIHGTPEQAGTLLARLDAATAATWTAGVTALEPEEELGIAITRADAQMYSSKKDRRTA